MATRSPLNHLVARAAAGGALGTGWMGNSSSLGLDAGALQARALDAILLQNSLNSMSQASPNMMAPRAPNVGTVGTVFNGAVEGGEGARTTVKDSEWRRPRGRPKGAKDSRPRKKKKLDSETY